MNKKLWIRLVGMLALFAWSVTAILVWASMAAPDASTKANVNILIFVSAAWTGIVTLLWTGFTVVDGLDHPARGKGVSC
jgi:hypothetical protein